MRPHSRIALDRENRVEIRGNCPRQPQSIGEEVVSHSSTLDSPADTRAVRRPEPQLLSLRRADPLWAAVSPLFSDFTMYAGSSSDAVKL